MSLAIEVRDLRKFYKSFPKKILALDDISLEVKQGDIFGFLGPNGAGKTTLIKIIIGMLHPDGGAVSIMGASPFQKETKRRLGYLPERPYFHDFLTGNEFLRFHGRLSDLSDELIERRIPEVLELVGLTKGRTLELKHYSKGMLQRIGLAQALLHNPDVLILDEPMSGLDPVGRREVRDLIQSIARMGKTIFFSTHIVHDVEVICNNFGFINNGRLKTIQSLENALVGKDQPVEVRFIMEAHKLKILPELSAASETLAGWVCEVGAPGVDQILTQILKNGGKVLSVTPKKSSLESLFFEESIS